MPELPGQTDLTWSLLTEAAQQAWIVTEVIAARPAGDVVDLDDLAALDDWTRRLNHERDAAIRSAVVDDGHTIRAVAHALGRSKSDVGRIVRAGRSA